MSIVIERDNHKIKKSSMDDFLVEREEHNQKKAQLKTMPSAARQRAFKVLQL